MSKYKNNRFNFSHLSERATFLTLDNSGNYNEEITVWAHFLKDGFTRSETDNFFKIMVREHRALEAILEVNGRVKWKNRLYSIVSWQDPSYEDRGYIELLVKQIATNDMFDESEKELFKDIVDIFRLQTIPTTSYGITSYSYSYDFSTPVGVGIRCSFSTDRNMYLEDKRFDTEHDSLVVKFPPTSNIQVEDYIVSPIHGKYKIDMITRNDDNMLEARVKRGDVQ